MGPCIHPGCLHDLETSLFDRGGQAGTVGGDALDDPQNAHFAGGAAHDPGDSPIQARFGGWELIGGDQFASGSD